MNPCRAGAGGHSWVVPACPSLDGASPGMRSSSLRSHGTQWGHTAHCGGHTAPQGVARSKSLSPLPSLLSLPLTSRSRAADSSPPFDVTGFSLTQILPTAVPLLVTPPGFRTPTAASQTGVPGVGTSSPGWGRAAQGDLARGPILRTRHNLGRGWSDAKVLF